MIETIKVRSIIGKDGVLEVQLPRETEGKELDIVIVYQTEETVTEPKTLSDFYGCIQDETFIRHPQPEQPEREPFL